MKIILEYLAFPSTWKGIIAIAAALGLALTEAQQGAIMSTALALIGLIQVFVDDQEEAPKE